MEFGQHPIMTFARIAVAATSAVELAAYDMARGRVDLAPAPSHRLILHLGAPNRAVRRFDGRAYPRLQTEGDVDIGPAGWPDDWEVEGPGQVMTVKFSEALLRQAAAEAGLAAGAGLAPQFQLRDPRLTHVVMALHAELAAGGVPDMFYADRLGLALAGHLLRRYIPAEKPVPGLSPRQWRRIAAYVDDHLDQPVGPAELAELTGISPSHLQALFRRTAGMPLHQYVIRRRVERARGLLAEGRLPLAEIALEAGFAHQSHMARWLRRLVGLSPAEIRRRHR